MNFTSEWPLISIIPILLLSAGLTWYFVVKNEKLKELNKKQLRLISLTRFLVFVLLGILLMGILFETNKYKIEKPIVINLIDNSNSMLNYKDSNEVAKQINKLNNSLELIKSDKFDLINYTIGDTFLLNNKIKLNEAKSKLSLAFEELFSTYYNRNIGGIIFTSDGNFNEGQNPVYAASKINLTPIFTLGIGDTTTKKDQLIRDVTANEVAFLNNKFLVEVNIEANKMGKRSNNVILKQNGNTIASKSINYTNGIYDSKQVIFEVEANRLGQQQYTVELSSTKNEYTRKNNTKSFYVEVLDARSKIIIIYGAPHPDVSTIKSVLEKNQNYEVEAKSIDKWDFNTKNTDLIIWHEPGINFNENINQKLLNSRIPKFYLISSNTSNSVIQKLNIGLNYTSSQSDDVQASLNNNFGKFELSDELKNAIEEFPPLATRFGSPKISNTPDILLFQKIGKLTKKDPLLFFNANAQSKIGVLLATGIWKWKMSEFLKNKNSNLTSELIEKSTQYLIQRENSSNLRISLPKSVSTQNEINVKAEFYNESMELITNPNIQFELIDFNKKKTVLEFSKNDNTYSLSLGKLRKGSYTWIATCKHDGKSYTKSGSFIVEQLDIEKIETKANHGLLEQLAKQSNGKFYKLDDFEKLMKHIQNRKDITTTSYAEKSFNNLIDYKWILFVIVLLLGFEWFIKRYNGLY